MTDNEDLNEKIRQHRMGQGFSQPPAVPYADAMTQLTRRVSGLEALLTRGAPMSEDYVKQMRERIEKLEEKCGTTLELMQRLEQLEHEHEGHNLERERQARWHQTRDAVLGGCYANPESDWLEADSLSAVATEAADRAHGPIEAKLTQRDIDDNVSKEWQRRVGALVKAAKGASTYCRDCGGGGFIVSHELDRALKPFEAST